MRNCMIWCVLLLGAACSETPKPAEQGKAKQDAGGKTKGPPNKLTVDLGGGVKLKMVLIPAGEFMMGSGESAEATADLFNKTYRGNIADATAKAWFRDWKRTIKASDGYVFTAPVGRFKPNSFGVFDMHGNAWQWCADWYGGDYYANSPTDDPTGPATGSSRVLRGGCWNDGGRLCRSAARDSVEPGHCDGLLGFCVSQVPGDK